MEISSKRTRVYNKFYHEDYDLDLKPNQKIRKPKPKKTSPKIHITIPDAKKRIKSADINSETTVEPQDKHQSGDRTDPSTSNIVMGNIKFDEKGFSEINLPYGNPPSSAGPERFHEHYFFNSIMNLSSINSESHKKYEFENLEFFKKVLEEKMTSYHQEDNNLIGHLPNELLVKNPDHQFLYPWINMIMPNHSKPYCRNLRTEDVNKNYEDGDKSDSYDQIPYKTKERILYLTENQIYLVVDSILEQIINTPQDKPVMIDWLKVSKASGLSQEVCKEFWWSFDKTHIRDDLGGFIFTGDWHHYYKVNDLYFLDLKHRVQCLIRLADQCKQEREKILNDFMNKIK